MFESVPIEEDANSYSKLAVETVFLIILAQIFVILYPYCFSFLSVSIIFSSLSRFSLSLIILGSNRGVHFFLYRSVSTGQVTSIESISVLISKTPILFCIRDCSVKTLVHFKFEAYLDYTTTISVLFSLLDSSND